MDYTSNIAKLACIVQLCVILSCAYAEDTKKPYKLVCYLGSWANYRNGNGKFLIENIDPFLCTHIVYGFAKLHENRIKAYDPYLDLKENWGLGAYKRFNALKEKNPNLSTLIAIGGWNEGSVKYSKMASNSTTRKQFIESCVQFIQQHGFDGLDLDWEYPTQRGGSPSDKKNFILLLKEMQQSFKSRGYLLTAAVSAGQNTIDAAYDIPEVSRYLDFINVMTYDFHGGWEQETGHNSPLFARPEETEQQKILNTDYAIKLWIKRGAPSEKIIMGMALYGRSFTLQNAQMHGLGAKIAGKGTAGRYTRESGFLGYNEICELVDTNKGWSIIFDGNHKVPYAFKDRQWVGYDNKESISLKVEYIRKMKLGGGMVWSIETDDFRGLCGDGTYPLLNTIKSGLNSIQPPTVKTTPIPEPLPPRYSPSTNISPTTSDNLPKSSPESPTTQNNLPKRTPKSPTTRDISPKRTPKAPTTMRPHPFCKEEGYFRDPTNCKKFYYCMIYEPVGFIAHEFNCGPGTVFSQEIMTCAYPYQVPECQT